MKIAFYSPHLCLRGTTVAMFGYAFHNQALLGNESIIFYERSHQHNHPSAISRFNKHFQCIAIDNIMSLDAALERLKADAVYIPKVGRRDERVANACKSLIHCIGVVNEPHGTKYAYGSEWLSQVCSNSTLPFVPYMIDLPPVDTNLRTTLGIPANATVLGRTGGLDSWNIAWAGEAVKHSLSRRPDLFYLFQNTPNFLKHPRIIHIPASASVFWKTMFINTCDGMLHVRSEGESFGLACGEFSVRNKPIITYSNSPERSHISILGDRGIYYSDQGNLQEKLRTFVRQPAKDWNCYRAFNPADVMRKFQEVYLK